MWDVAFALDTSEWFSTLAVQFEPDVGILRRAMPLWSVLISVSFFAPDAIILHPRCSNDMRLICAILTASPGCIVELVRFPHGLFHLHATLTSQSAEYIVFTKQRWRRVISGLGGWARSSSPPRVGAVFAVKLKSQRFSLVLFHGLLQAASQSCHCFQIGLPCSAWAFTVFASCVHLKTIILDLLTHPSPKEQQSRLSR